MTHDPLLLALIGHLVGDYILQADWMALNKKNPRHGPWPEESKSETSGEYLARYNAWSDQVAACWIGRIACFLHCLVWTTCVCLFAGWSNPWAIAFLFATHFVQDRTNVIRWWMKTVGQEKFATGPCSPWSIIVVDNVWHVLQIYAVARWIA